MKSSIQKKKESDVLLKETVFTINQKLDAQTKKAIDDARKPDASSWLSAISHDQYGFSLNKAEFRDAILSRYGKELKGFHVLVARSTILHKILQILKKVVLSRLDQGRLILTGQLSSFSSFVKSL